MTNNDNYYCSPCTHRDKSVAYIDKLINISTLIIGNKSLYTPCEITMSLDSVTIT